MNNVISLCDYKQKKLDELMEMEIEQDLEFEWDMADAVVSNILIAEDVTVLSVVDKCDTMTITLTISPFKPK
jgi:hypothetical protein